MKKEKEKIRLSRVAFILMIFMFGMFGGMVIGMELQQILTMSLVRTSLNALSGSNFDVTVNFNETKFVEEFNKTIMPQVLEE